MKKTKIDKKMKAKGRYNYKKNKKEKDGTIIEHCVFLI